MQKCQCSLTTTHADNVFRESYRKYKNRDIFFACSYGPQLDFLSKMSKKSRDTVSLIFVHVSFFNSVPLIRPSLFVYNTKNTISLLCQRKWTWKHCSCTPVFCRILTNIQFVNCLNGVNNYLYNCQANLQKFKAT